MKDYLYYPGCSLKGTGVQYEKSLLACMEALDIKVSELPDWNCCGATSYMAVNEKSAFGMAARNIAIAEREEKDVLAPCSACYMVLNKAVTYANEYPDLKCALQKAMNAVDMDFDGNRQEIIHPLHMLVYQYGLEKIEAQVKRPLKGMKIFPYYGCLIARPKAVYDDATYPVSMDMLMGTLGADVIDHTLKTRCCGGTITGTISEVGLRMVYILLKEAKKKGAEAIVTICPLCQFNLEAYQKKVEKVYKEKFDLPVLYFTQLLGVALGVEEKKLGFEHQIISAKNLLTKTQKS
jgi:heterodisulfide reductase subunit B